MHCAAARRDFRQGTSFPKRNIMDALRRRAQAGLGARVKGGSAPRREKTGYGSGAAAPAGSLPSGLTRGAHPAADLRGGVWRRGWRKNAGDSRLAARSAGPGRIASIRHKGRRMRPACGRLLEQRRQFRVGEPVLDLTPKDRSLRHQPDQPAEPARQTLRPRHARRAGRRGPGVRGRCRRHSSRRERRSRVGRSARGPRGSKPAVPDGRRQRRKPSRQAAQPSPDQNDERHRRPVLGTACGNRPAQPFDDEGQAVRQASRKRRWCPAHERRGNTIPRRASKPNCSRATRRRGCVTAATILASSPPAGLLRSRPG
jgi:hypothetical protein